VIIDQVSGSTPSRASVRALLERVNRWVLVELTRLNRQILAGSLPPEALTREFSQSVLADLIIPEVFTPAEARQMVMLLGISGASVARHFQEADLSRKACPNEAFSELYVGSADVSFLEYFRRLADVTGTGHCARDTYASLVRWNVPAVEVRLDDQVIVVLPGSFDDLRIRTYTGDPSEAGFFELLKKSEALELAANNLLRPLSDGTVDILTPDAESRARSATRLLVELHRINQDFASLPPERGGMIPDHFMDVFRQFAVHWELDDVPPSGAQDSEYLLRDLLLGIAFPGYGRHLERIYPALLKSERDDLTKYLGRPSITQLLLTSLDLDEAALAAMSVDELAETVRRYPILVAWHQLLTANARMGSVHLMLTEKFLFKPQRHRDQVGLGDSHLVSNREGTTGMDEPLLLRLARARREHPLRPLANPGIRALVRPTPNTHPPIEVRFVANAK
jgi:hypothetical protein